MHIRVEQPTDILAIHQVNEAAFETSAEANLVDVLRTEANPVISLVAEADGKIIGHILFTPVALSGRPDLQIMGLGPMAVLPGQQRQGVGSDLVRAGLEHCRQLEFGAVVVLGHPTYYPRFGFIPSARFGIGCEFDVPEEVFMAMELQPGYLRQAEGTIHYHPAFSRV